MRLIYALAVCLHASLAFAWSNKEHIQFARIAAERLVAAADTPAEMKEWLRRACPGQILDEPGERDYFLHQRIGLIPRGCDGIPYWATMPDMLALTDAQDKKVEPFGVHERLLHFIDLEFFTAEGTPHTYADDLSHKPKVKDFPRDMTEERYRRAGMLPFRVEQCYGELVKMLRAKRLIDTPGQYPRDEHAAKWAGFLAHYAADNTQPQHATEDYKSQSYFHGPPRKAPNVHAEVEYKMCDDDQNDYPKLRAEFWTMFERELTGLKDPVQTNDPCQATVEVSLLSYDALPLIGAASQQATKPDGSFDTEAFFRFRGKMRGEEVSVVEMKARQTAWAVLRIQRLWRQAWDAAAVSQPSSQP